MSPRARVRTLGLALGLAAGAGVGAAGAAPLPVATGDHPGFARIVLPLPPGAPWSVAPAPDGVELELPPDASFDLARAFARIGRDRIAGLADTGEGRLRVAVACDCHVAASVVPQAGQDWLVLDVADGPVPAEGPGLVALGPPSADPPPADPPPAGVPPAEADGAMAEAPRGAGPAPEADPRFAALGAAIVQGFAEAAGAGALDLAPGVQAPAPAEREPEPPAADAPAPPGEPFGPAAAGGPGIAIRTASDRPATAPLAQDGAACRPDAEFDLAAWAPSGDFAREMGARHAALTDGRDRLDPEGVEALARAYLAFGFGREAAATLGLDGRQSRARDLLRLLAAIVDGDPVEPGALESQAGCAGAVALWRALARGSLEGTSPEERTAVEAALRALPAALRGPVSVRLADLFVARGSTLTAEALLAERERVPETPAAAEAPLVAARLAGATEGPEAEMAGLARVAPDPRQEPGALLDLVELSIAEGRPLEPGTLDLIAARRFEHRGTPEGAALRRAEVRAQVAAGRIDAALAAVAEGVAEGEFDPAARDALLVEALGAAAMVMDDGPFAELALGGLPPELPAAALRPVAGRLAALGFPEEAARLRATGRPAPPEPPDEGGGRDARPETGSETGSATGTATGPDRGPGAGSGAGSGPASPVARPEAEPRLEAEPRAEATAPPAASVVPAGDGPPSLAQARALLDEAGAARDRARALIEAPMPEAASAAPASPGA